MEVGLYKDNKIGVIIQARMSSTRMPGKIMQSLPYAKGKSILDQIISAVESIKKVNFICIATSVNHENDIIEESFNKKKIVVFRGDEENVLSRYAIITEKYHLDHVIRLTGDNPIIDGDILSDLIDFHLEKNHDHSSTSLLPIGTNISMFSAKVLKEAYQNATQDYEKEHVEPWILNNPNLSKGVLKFETYKKLKDVRLTIDYPSDYAFLNIIFNYFENINQTPSIAGVYELLEKLPWLKEINNNNYQKRAYNTNEEEINDAIRILENLELHRTAQLLKNNTSN